MRGHYRDAIWGDANVSQQEGQDALPDAAKADEKDAPRKIDVNFVFAHDAPSVKTKPLAVK